MDAGRFRAAAKRVWLPAILLLAAAIAGSIVYVNKHILPSAKASVAVRDVLTVNTAQSTAAEVPFDSIIKSNRLTQLVSEQLGPSVGKVSLSVDVVFPQSGINISPLYVVHAQATTEAKAKQIVNAAVQQGTLLYAQLNSVNVKAMTAALQPQVDSANAALAKATTAYDDFVAKSGGDQSGQIAALDAETTAITGQIAQLRAGTLGQPSSTVLLGLQQQLDEAQSRLRTLQPLQAQFEQVATTLTDAQATARQMQQLMQQTFASGAIPVADQVKVLDLASPESKGVMKVLVYALGLVVGLLAAFTLLYVEAARQRARTTPEQLVTTLGVPALARIPGHAMVRGA